MAGRLTQQQSIFIHRYTDFGQGIGLPRSAAQVLGFLVISKPEHQTAEDIRQTLDLSTGSVSIAVTMLCGMGLIERVRVKGERKHYYRLAPNGFLVSIHRRLRTFRTAKDIAEFGLHINPNDKRLLMMERLFTFIDSEVQQTVKKLEELSEKEDISAS